MAWEIALALFFVGAAGIFAFLSTKTSNTYLHIGFIILTFIILGYGLAGNKQIIDANNSSIGDINATIYSNLYSYQNSSIFIIIPLISLGVFTLLILLIADIFKRLKETLKKKKYTGLEDEF